MGEQQKASLAKFLELLDLVRLPKLHNVENIGRKRLIVCGTMDLSERYRNCY